MKKLIHLLFIVISINCFSQAITVNTTTFSVPQLVNTVLINSPCVSASNVSSSTGANFGSSNGIGYFTNTNPNFPMKSGVVLSTGAVASAIGPNKSELNEGAANWPGDSDLEKILFQSGIKMNSVNATVIEFDFTPISPSFSFEFLFASEEYGNFQCQFSDAFAFLLTDMSTGITTNLAVVPNTNQPISVVTIRDYIYNSSCPSANVEYFGSFNGDSAADGSATNFNGQTKLLNASALLKPNTPYHIKLVIADRTDSGSDSAIFIASDTFNIGQDVLGQDLTIANNSAICFNSSHTLKSNLSPTEYTFKWSRNGVIIPEATNENLIVTKTGTYGVTYEKISSSCEPTTDFINVEYLLPLVTKNPINLYKCDTEASSYLYDLSINTNVVRSGLINPLTDVDYYASLADANSDTNKLPLNYIGTVGQTIYVRIRNRNNACYDVIKSFQLLVTKPPVANKPDDLIKCSTSPTITTSVFRLADQSKYILNGQSDVTNEITYHISLLNANNSTTQLNRNSYVGSNDTVIYARIQNKFDNSCYNVTSFKLIVNQSPLVDKLPDVTACTSYILQPLTNGNYFLVDSKGNKTTPVFAGDSIEKTQGIMIFNQPGGPDTCFSATVFRITIIDEADLPKSKDYCDSYTLPRMPFGNYYSEPHGNEEDKLPLGTKITETKKLYFYYKTLTEPFCEIDIDFTVTITPVQNVGTFKNVFDCDSYTLPPLSVGNYYTNKMGAGTKLEAGTILTSSQKVYVFSTSGSPYYCYSESSFKVIIGIDTPEDIIQCGSFTLPELAIGKYYTGPAGTGTELEEESLINESKTIYIYVQNAKTPNCTDFTNFKLTIGQPKIDILDNVTVCESFTLPNLINEGKFYTGPNETGKMLNAGDKITSTQTIYIFNRSGLSCSNQSNFKVTVNQKPMIDSRSDIDICNFYELTPLKIGNYYTGPGGTGTKLDAGTKITSAQTIYIYATDPITKCSDENSFKLNIFSIEADAPEDVTACDSFTLPALKNGNYYSQPNGPNGGEGTFMNAGDVITTTQTIYVYIESGERINCTDENVFVVTINKTPKVVAVPDVYTCNSFMFPELSIGNYFTEPNGTGTMLNEDDVITSSQKIYMYAQTATTPNCYDEKSFYINVFNVDHLSNVTVCENYRLPELKVGAYYSGPSGTGLRLAINELITNSRTIYIYAPSPFNPVCYGESSFVVTIIPKPVAYPVPNGLTTVCDEDGENDGKMNFDLTKLNTTVLGNQKTTEFSVKYYATPEDAVAERNGLNETNLPLVYARVNNSLANSCYDLRNISITVIKAPIPYPKGGFVCIDSKTNTLLNSYTIPSGLDNKDYAFKWLDASGKIVGTDNTYEAKLTGSYTLITTSKKSGCSSFPIVSEVFSSEKAKVTLKFSEDFSDYQTITVDAEGVGGFYEYQLDSGYFQDSPVFDNVLSGLHTINVNDKNGCGNSVVQALAINYPKYFTPNGDGVNDTWNISSLSGQYEAIIKIFDRYGKMIKEIKPSETGWDGTFSGQNMPSSDYWFTIFYEKDGNVTEFKSHFAMKR
ncbi:T9SS type B sorting domain-containing protein [Flavobacterium luteum]|uniref:T9SS type B sorting domain-containing protein n=1 Tax=Flavobacterium luteum TaxID=2026654 RepID=A0A7J5AC05_9FLAO|nr:choice-of-anchor L domain-containing protein [Flavobacterium luteum]KAB1155096.1 T9SS type B sorting domain-containing protein [Flavobacterium luteum]